MLQRVGNVYSGWKLDSLLRKLLEGSNATNGLSLSLSLSQHVLDSQAHKLRCGLLRTDHRHGRLARRCRLSRCIVPQMRLESQAYTHNSESALLSQGRNKSYEANFRSKNPSCYRKLSYDVDLVTKQKKVDPKYTNQRILSWPDIGCCKFREVDRGGYGDTLSLIESAVDII